MFDKNKSIKVGRDINIQIDKKNFETLSNDELTQKRSNSKLILNKESGAKMRRSLNCFITWGLLFLLLYIGIPFFFENYGNENNLIVKFLKLIYNEKTWGMLSGIASFLAILNPLNDVWKTNEIEKKQNQILKTINTILKEREYLKNQNNIS